MLVKCICANCAHSYLADDQAGELACPRCGVSNESARNPSDIPDAPGGVGGGAYDYYDEGYEDAGFEVKAAPAMTMTFDRLLRGVVFGGLMTALVGVALAGALTATRIAVPAVIGIVLGLAGGASCRWGFGGRCSPHAKGRAITVVFIVLLLGFAGSFAGAWVVERYTGNRAVRTRDDLDRGLRTLSAEASRNGDEGTRLLLNSRIKAIKGLQSLDDAGLEDYLWTQQAQINQPLFAYSKLRATRGPVVRMGPNQDPIELPPTQTLGILGAELLVGVWLASRGVLR